MWTNHEKAASLVAEGSRLLIGRTCGHELITIPRLNQVEDDPMNRIWNVGRLRAAMSALPTGGLFITSIRQLRTSSWFANIDEVQAVLAGRLTRIILHGMGMTGREETVEYPVGNKGATLRVMTSDYLGYWAGRSRGDGYAWARILADYAGMNFSSFSGVLLPAKLNMGVVSEYDEVAFVETLQYVDDNHALNLSALRVYATKK